MMPSLGRFVDHNLNKNEKGMIIKFTHLNLKFYSSRSRQSGKEQLEVKLPVKNSTVLVVIDLETNVEDVKHSLKLLFALEVVTSLFTFDEGINGSHKTSLRRKVAITTQQLSFTLIHNNISDHC